MVPPIDPLFKNRSLEEGPPSTLESFTSGMFWAGSAWGSFRLVNPMLVSTATSASGLKIGKYAAYDEAYAAEKFGARQLLTETARAAFSPSAAINRALKQKITVDYQSLSGLEHFFSPFMENRLLKGSSLYRDFHRTSYSVKSGGKAASGYQAYGDIYDYGIAKIVGGNVLKSDSKVETTVGAYLTSQLIDSPLSMLFKTLSVYPAMINTAMPTGSKIDASLIQYDITPTSMHIEFTKHNLFYAKKFGNFQSSNLLQHGIDLYSQEGLESFNKRVQSAAFSVNKRRQEKIKQFTENLISKHGPGAKINPAELSAMTYKELAGKVGRKGKLHSSISQSGFNDFKRLVEQGGDITEIFKEAGLSDEVISELPAFLRLQNQTMSLGTLGHYSGKQDVLKKIADNVIAGVRGHGVKGSHLYPSKFTRTVEASAGITDIEGERMDERWLFMSGKTSSLTKDSLHTMFARYVRLLDSPGDVFSYFTEDETHAEKMSNIMKKIEETVHNAAASGQSNLGSIHVESKAKRYAKNLLNRFGTGGEYDTSFGRMVFNHLMPTIPGLTSAANLQEERQAYYVLARRADLGKVTKDQYIEAAEKARGEFVEQLRRAPSTFESKFGKEGVEAFLATEEPFIRYGEEVAYVMAPYVKKVQRFRFGAVGLGLAVGAVTDTIPIVREPIRAFNLMRAAIGDVTGLNAYVKSSEQYAPGSTSPWMMLGVPLTFGTAAYFGTSISQAHKLYTSTAKGMERTLLKESFQMKRSISNPFAREMLSKVGLAGPRTAAGAAGMTAMAVGFLFNLPMLPGQLANLIGGGKSYSERQAEYSGKIPVPIMKGRWWEAGLSQFEGDKLGYYRASLMRATPKEARDMDLYGDPDSNFANVRSTIEQMFSYNLEERNYRHRPYAATAAAFSDIFGPMTPIMNATLGEMIKPTKMMHSTELFSKSVMESSGDGYALYSLPSSGKMPNMMESTTPGVTSELNMPTSESSFGIDKLTLRESFYRLGQEASGLPGFLMQSSISSKNDFDIMFDDQAFAERADRIAESRRMFWDMELGGLFGMCFVAGSKINTYHGEKNIEEITEGDLVLSKDGSYRKVLELYKNKLAGRELREIKTTLGKSLKCTANHVIPVLRRKRYKGGHAAPFDANNYSIIEIPASEIVRGDYLFVPIDKEENELTIDLAEYNEVYTHKYVYSKCCQEWADCYENIENNPNITRRQLRDLGYQDKIAKEVLFIYRNGAPPTRYKRYIDIDQNLSYLFGWYIAEGSSESSGRVTLTMNIKEKDYADHLGSIVKNNFNVDYSISLDQEANSLTFRFSCWALIGLFESFGRGAHSKYIPEKIKQLPQQHIMALVSGLMLGDGWVNLDNAKYFGGFTSVSKKLTQDLSYLLLKLKIDHGALFDYVEIPKESYLPGGTLRKPSKRNYIKLNKGKYNNSFLNDSYLVSVNSNEVLNENHEFVYDIHVEDLHYYTVDGICVHNSEPVRRLYPVRRFAEDWQTPIANDQPSWMPGQREMINFKEGDPYGQIAAGELRLPGMGYTLVRPDLAGVDPEQYDASTKMQILADVAPYSKAYKKALTEFEKNAGLGMLNEEQLERGQMAKMIRRHMISPHKYREGDPEGAGAMASYSGTIGELMRSSPFERLIPFAPGHKFGPHRTAIEKYREFLEYGGDMQRWTHPVQDFITKFFTGWTNLFSTSPIVEPNSKVEKIREVNNVFNAMEYLKATSFGQGLGMSWKAKNSIPGVNPWAASLEDIQFAMPEQERPFFLAFAEEKSFARQKLILEMIPKEHQRIYKAIWARKLVHEARDANNFIFADKNINRASDVISRLAKSEFQFKGGPFGLFKKTDSEYRADLAREIIDDYGGAVPNMGWLGWNKDVRLKDVKLQHVLNEGEDIHDFNLWEPQQAELRYKDRIPDITEQFEEAWGDNLLSSIGGLLKSEQSGYYSGEPGSSEYNVMRRLPEREISFAYNQDN